MKFLTHCIILFLLFFSEQKTLFAQNKSRIDSLNIELLSKSNPNTRLDIYKKLFSEHIKGSYNQALDFSYKEYQQANKNQDLLLKIDALQNIAYTYNQKSNYDSAIYYINQAIDLSKKRNLEQEENDSYLIAAEILQDKEYINKSTSYLFKALRYFENQESSNTLAEIYLYIGKAFAIKKEYAKASEYYKKALDIYESLNNQDGIAKVYIEMGFINYAQDKYTEAILFFKKSLDIAKVIFNTNLSSLSYYSLSLPYAAIDSNDLALQMIYNSIEIDKQLKNTNNLFMGYDALSSIYTSMDSLDKADYYSDLSLTLAKKMQIPALLYGILSNKIDINYKKGDYKKAIETYYERDKIHADFFPDKKDKIAELDLKYQEEKIRNQLILKHEAQKFKTLLYTGSLLLFIAILIVIVLLLKNKAKRSIIKSQELNDELNYKNKELSNYMIQLVNKKELNDSIVKELQELLLTSINQTQKAKIKSIIRDLQVNSNENIWKEFEVRFLDVHKDFYSKLAKEYPELTANERRLAAFLKLNMTTKEISAITLKSVASIEMARTRLRKKLGLNTSKESLVSFFSKF